MDFVQNVGRREIDKGGEIGAFVDLGVQSLNGYERNKLYRNLGAGAGGVPAFADFGYLAGADRIEDGRSAVAFDLGRLEAIGTPDARRALEKVAAGEPTARLTRDAAGGVRRLGGR